MGRKSTLALTRTKGTEAAAASQCSEAGLAASRDDGHLSRAFARGAMVFQFMRTERGDSGGRYFVVTFLFMDESRGILVNQAGALVSLFGRRLKMLHSSQINSWIPISFWINHSLSSFGSISTPFSNVHLSVEWLVFLDGRACVYTLVCVH